MADTEAYFYGPATEFFEDASADDQRELDRIVRNLCDAPGIDHQLKFWFPASPAVFSLYADGRFWVVYHQRNNLTLGILNIGHATEDPDWR